EVGQGLVGERLYPPFSGSGIEHDLLALGCSRDAALDDIVLRRSLRICARDAREYDRRRIGAGDTPAGLAQQDGRHGDRPPAADRRARPIDTIQLWHPALSDSPMVLNPDEGRQREKTGWRMDADYGEAPRAGNLRERTVFLRLLAIR